MHPMCPPLYFPKIHYVGGFWWNFLKVVSHGDFVGSIPWRLKHCINPILGSWNESIMLCSIQFTAGGVCSTALCSKMVGVLKWVNSDVKHKGLERSQFWCFAIYVASEGPERSQFGLKCHVCHSSHSQCPHRVLNEVQRLMLKVGMTFCWPISPSCLMQGVTFLEVGLLVLGQYCGWGSDGCNMM